MHMYKRPGAKGLREHPSHVNKQTNTPSDFALCSLCEEKFTPKHGAHSCLTDQERNIKEYSNALSYINSCHSIINHMMMQNKEFKDTYVNMPNIPNFMDLFSVLLTHGWESKKKEKQQAKSCEPHLLNNKNLAEGEHPHSTESENSDFEMEVIQQASKVPTQKFKSKLPRTDDTIYEEDVPASAKPSKRPSSSAVKPNQRKTSPTGPRGKRYSDIISPPVQDGPTRKVKQRSYSAVSPRSKSGFNENKSGPDLSANYSDTVLTANSGNNKNDDLSQQDLDKFAKELLGSGSNSPIHSPRSSSPDNRSLNGPTPPDKSPVRGASKPSKPGAPPVQATRKYSELLKKTYPVDRSPSPSQEGIRTPMKNQSEVSMLPTQITLQAKKTKLQKPPQRLTPERPGTPTIKMSSTNNYVYSAMQPPKEKAFNSEDNPYAMQQYIQLAMKRSEQVEEDENYEKQDAYDSRKPLKGTPSKCNQFAVKIKSKEGCGRKLSAADMKIIESQVQLFVEHHMESDEAKTDSDIEEDKKQQAEDRQVRGDERKAFRGPRKHSESDEEEQVVKFTEALPAYQRIHQPPISPKRSQMSDESSDIKSDEDAYDHRQRPVHVHRRGAAYNSYSPTRR